MDKKKQPLLRKRKEPLFSGQNHQPSRTPSVPLTQIPTPQVSNRRVPLSDLLTPPSSNRVSLAELLTYDPLKENLPPSLSNTSSTQPSKHTASSTTHQQPRASNRLPLGDVTNRLFGQTTNNIFPLNSHVPLATQLSPFTPVEATHVRRTAASNFQSQLVGNANLRGVSSISLPRSDHQPSTVAATRKRQFPLHGFSNGPFALMANQPTVTTSPSSNAFIRTPSSTNSSESPTRVALNTSDTVRRSRTMSNGLATSFDPATPVNGTRRQKSPFTDVSNVSLHTPLTSVGCVNQCNNITSTGGFTTTIPALVTQTSTFEVGESSRRTKRSKRPSLQSRTPVIFNLNLEDGDVRKEYDKYIGVFEEYFDHGDPTFECTECHALSTLIMVIRRLSAQNVMLWYGRQKQEKETLIQQTNPIVYAVARANGSCSSSGQSTSDDRTDRNIIAVLIAKRGKDGRNYNLPTSNEVAGLIVGDFDTCIEDRDIVIEKYREGLQRINIFHPMYLPLQYPLLMPRAQDGYYLGIPHRKKAGRRPPGTTADGEQVNQAVDEIQAFLDCR
ncbi:hypothetical protein CTI12_AA057680 [Artemisia annua]|uniref:Helitron helicase-like domain-containing protein n=1 Tax=Artemisia annua TaxID=35608 RepID=A0A2U1NQH5_ARTAN|nr:hypothetical protein CTI12_AA057680 [Artemisia annua]